ncbi:MAG: hypothetical protein K0S49_28 [Microbacterium sp.]|jgi:hypothetical protein|nr:hypothetical protein [Microbacterium sp.]
MPWENSRPTHVPTAVREACLRRDGYRCVAQLNTGDRCPATTNLEAAHLAQWNQLEETTVDDVRTLCHWHHNRETQAQAAAARSSQPRPSAIRSRETHPAHRGGGGTPPPRGGSRGEEL